MIDQAVLNGVIDISKAASIEDDFLVIDPVDKLNILGEFYQCINAPRYLNTGTRLKEIVDRAAE